MSSDHFGCGGVLDGHAGWGVAISGDGNTVAVGAPHESSGAKGINGNQNDNSMYGVRCRVRLRAERCGVGAAGLRESRRIRRWAPSSATSSRSALTATRWPSRPSGKRASRPASTAIREDHSIPQAGAAYVFTRKRDEWTQQAYIKASNTGEGCRHRRQLRRWRPVRCVVDAQRRRPDVGGRCNHRGQRVARHQRQPGRQLGTIGWRRVRLRTARVPPGRNRRTSRPANPDPGDMFGYSVSLSADGNTLAAGSYDEGGSREGINGPLTTCDVAQAPSTSSPARATTWTQQAYIHASNAEGGDSFGVNVVLERRWEYAAGELAGRRLHGDRRQPARLRQRSGGRYLHRRGVRVRAQRRHVDAAGVPEGIQHGGQRLVRLARRFERRRQHRRSSTRRSRTARGRASTASRTTTRRQSRARSTCSRAPARRGASSTT